MRLTSLGGRVSGSERPCLCVLRRSSGRSFKTRMREVPMCVTLTKSANGTFMYLSSRLQTPAGHTLPSCCDTTGARLACWIVFLAVEGERAGGTRKSASSCGSGEADYSKHVVS